MTNERIQTAINGALVSRGPKKGMLKAQCPAMGTDASAAWLAIQFHANPYKVGMGHLLLMDAERSELFHLIRQTIKELGLDVRGLDRDRRALETLGVW